MTEKSDKPEIDEAELFRGDLTPLITTFALGARTVARCVTRVQVEQKPIDLRSVLWSGSVNVAGLVSQALLLVDFLLASGDLYIRLAR